MTDLPIAVSRLSSRPNPIGAALAAIVLFFAVSTGFAQDEAAPAVAPANPPAEAGDAPVQPGFSFTSMIPLYLGLFLLWYLIVLRPQSSQKARRAELLAGLKKNDKVITVGGIVGTVGSVHESTGEVTIKSNDTSIRITRDAVRDVVEETPKENT